MGNTVSVQTAVANINNSIKVELENQANASATTDCAIEMDSVHIGLAENCSITFENFCSAEAEASVQAAIDALMQTVSHLSVSEKTSMAGYFQNYVGVQTTVENYDNSIREYMNNKCTAEGLINNKVKIKDFYIGTCKGPASNPINIHFYNSGQASANCVIETVINTALYATNELTADVTTGFDFVGIINSLIWPLAIAAIIILVGYVVIKLLSNSHIKPADKIDLELAKHNSYSSNIKSLMRH